jgi:PqqA peptide cyclase
MIEPALPVSAVLELTHRCPLACAYCSNPVAGVPRKDELEQRDWLTVVDQAADLGVLQVHFSGGEPLLRPDLEQLVERAALRGLYTNLITSGLPSAPDRLGGLREAGLSAVQVSFQDADEALNDQAADFVSHAKKLEFAGAVKSLGLGLTINLVIARYNAGNVARMLDLARGLGAERIELAHVQYHGFARLNRAALLPSLEQAQAVRALADAARVELAGRAELIHVMPDYLSRYPKRCMGGWGTQSFVVAPDGMVLPCHSARSLPLVFESIRKAALRSIWYDSPAFQRFRGSEWLEEPCRSCERREIDLGGCRCQAFELTGRLTAADPVCVLSPEHQLVTSARSERSDAPMVRPHRVLPLLG